MKSRSMELCISLVLSFLLIHSSVEAGGVIGKQSNQKKEVEGPSTPADESSIVSQEQIENAISPNTFSNVTDLSNTDPNDTDLRDPIPPDNWDGYTKEGLSYASPSPEIQQEFFSRKAMFLLAPLYHLDSAMQNRLNPDSIPIPNRFKVTKLIGRTNRIINGMVLESEKDMVIVFRGTKTPNEWLHNCHVTQAQPSFGAGEWFVHRGFWNLYDSSARKHLDWIMEKAHSKTNVYISATSMGGAVGSLLAMEMAFRNKDLGSKLIVYTFGSPRVMNPPMAKAYEILVPKTLRVSNHHDPVIRLPFEYGVSLAGRYPLYQHVGNNFEIVAEQAHMYAGGYPGSYIPLYHKVLPAYYYPLAHFFNKYEKDFKQPHWRDKMHDLSEYLPAAVPLELHVKLRACCAGGV